MVRIFLEYGKEISMSIEASEGTLNEKMIMKSVTQTVIRALPSF